jgi:predicted O-linked N-acetylglucosamine transferase (SPINDLY family)
MARGWESKDVESQVQDRKTVADNSGRAQKSAEDLRKEAEKRGLALSRVRIKNDLESATNPNHRKSLEAALAYLDKKIADLN